MAKQNTYLFICDLCEESEKSRNGTLPVNWTGFIPGGLKVEKHICDECSLTIKQEHRG